MNKYNVSIIIPAYNVAPYICKCLESVAGQTYSGAMECLIVDDCGSDNSIQIAEDFIDGYVGPIDFRIIHRKKNGGLSAARNTGLHEAKGEYVFFLDSDDQITKDCFSVFFEPLQNKKYDMVIAGRRVIGAEDKFPNILIEDGEIVGHKAIISSKRRGLWYPMTWNKLYRRELLISAGLDFCEGIIHEDEIFCAELACIINSMYVIKSRETYLYMIRSNSIMTSLQYERRRLSYTIMLSHFHDFLNAHKMLRDSDANDMLQVLFKRANDLALRQGVGEYKEMYKVFRESVNKKYGERFVCNNRLNAFIRDLHYLVPVSIASHLYRKINLRGIDA